MAAAGLLAADAAASTIMSEDSPSTGRLADGAHLFPLRVYYEDTDAGQVAYHASYLRWFERGRTEALALLGAGRSGAGEAFYVVAEVALRYRRPAQLGDALIVRTQVARIRSAACVVHQAVIRDEEVLAEGEVVLVYVGADGRPRRQPAAWVEAFRTLAGAAPAP